MPLSFRDFEVIRAVIRTGSVTEAANALNISQPAVSMILRHCTEEAGFPLFVRKRGRLQPTSEASALVPEIQRIFDGADRVRQLVYELRGTRVGLIRIATTHDFAEGVLAQIAADFQRSRPGIQIAIERVGEQQVADHIGEGHADFGLVLSAEEQPNTRAIKLCSSELVCIVRRDHPLAGRKSVSPKDLSASPLISFGTRHSLGSLIDKAYQSQGLVRSMAVEVTQSSTAFALVKAGAGVAILDAFATLGDAKQDIARLKFTPKTEVEAQILLPRRGHVSRAANLLIGALRSAVPRLLQ